MAWVGLLHTLLALANVSCAAICVDDTLWSTACDGVWFGNISWEAVTNWVSKMVDLASGSWTTGTGITRVRLRHTLLVLADVTIVTVRIYLALRSTAGDGVWFWDQTRKAVTN